MAARLEWFRRAAMPAIVLTLVAGVPAGASGARTRGDRVGVRATAAPGTADQQRGRYKREGDNCVWDARDTGPNQCTPVTIGRFKQEGKRCVWDASDKGPDQCTPAHGRFKQEGDKCVWTPGDSGPNQCNPRRPR